MNKPTVEEIAQVLYDHDSFDLDWTYALSFAGSVLALLERRTGNGDAEGLARRFHETYERLAPSFGYETRRDSAVPWEQVPERNRRLMIAVCSELLPDGKPDPAPVASETCSDCLGRKGHWDSLGHGYTQRFVKCEGCDGCGMRPRKDGP